MNQDHITINELLDLPEKQRCSEETLQKLTTIDLKKLLKEYNMDEDSCRAIKNVLYLRIPENRRDIENSKIKSIHDKVSSPIVYFLVFIIATFIIMVSIGYHRNREDYPDTIHLTKKQIKETELKISAIRYKLSSMKVIPYTEMKTYSQTLIAAIKNGIKSNDSASPLLDSIQTHLVSVEYVTIKQTWLDNIEISRVTDAKIIPYSDVKPDYMCKIILIPSNNTEKKAIRLESEYGYPKQECVDIVNHRVWIGMTSSQLRASRGAPDSINRTQNAYGTDEQWVYGLRDYIYLVNDVVTTIQD